MFKRGSSTVRGAKPPTNRTTAEHVFGYATIPRNFRGSVHNNRSPGSPFNNGRGAGGGVQYNTYGRYDGQNMTSFGGGGVGRVDVVDGLVINRFQKPQSIYGTTSEVMKSDFYRNPGTTVSVTSPPPQISRFREDYSRDDSFEGDLDSPNSIYSEEMSYNNNYSSKQPPAIPENPPAPRRPPPDNKPSLLLSREENQAVFDILGKGRQTLATAVVQLLAPTPDQSRWQVKETGVVCLVRDTTKKSYFIQVLSLASRSMVFRQEIYSQFEYEVPNQCFLTFEGDNFTVGINFADPTEAGNFRDGLDSKLEAKRQRRNEREHRRSRFIPDNHSPSYAQNQPQSQYQPQQQQRNNNPPPMTNGASTISTTYTFPVASTPKNKVKSKGKDKNKKISLRKEDIGKPMDFRHVQHVGWDPNKGFDLNGVDNDLRIFFEKAGVSSDALKDENTRKFIYNFIEQHGGVDSIRNARPVAPPPPPTANPNVPPPPIPNRMVQSQKPAAPPPPSRPIPPVPAPAYNQSVPPPPPPMRTCSSNVAERPPANQFQSNGPVRPPPPSFANSPKQGQSQSNGAPPPPPPPPPMPGFGVPPPPPPPPMAMAGQPPSESTRNVAKPSLPPVIDDRSNFLAAIQKGVQLKHVDPSDTPPKKTGGLADCLGQIQKGVDLKPVQQMPKEPPTIDTMDGLAGALARALADRNRAINPDTSSDDDDEEEAEDEWED